MPTFVRVSYDQTYFSSACNQTDHITLVLIATNFDLSGINVSCPNNKWLFLRTPPLVEGLKQAKPRLDSQIFLLDPHNRTSFTITEIYCVGNEHHVENEVEVWHEGERQVQAQSIWARRSDLRGVELRTGYIEYKPYLFIPGDDHANMYGFDLDLNNELRRRLNFTSKRVYASDGNFGKIVGTNGEWNGIIGLILDGSVDLSMSLLGPSVERAEVIDFTSVVEVVSPILVSHKPKTVVANSFLAVFGEDAWWAILGTFVTMMLGAGVIAWVMPPEEENKAQPGSFIFQVLCAFVCQGSTLTLDKLSMKILVFSCLAFGLISFAVFGALLASFLSVRKIVEAIE